MTVAPAGFRATAAIALAPLLLAGCATVVPEPGGHRPTPTPPPAPPAPLPTPASTDWQDWPLTPGNWTYARSGSSTLARFASGGTVHAWVRCDLTTRVVAIGRSAPAADISSMMTVRTSFGTAEWPARAVGGATPGVEAVRSASDPGLDQIAFTRGRFALMLRDRPPVIAPSWAEPVRVVEDCRG
ncbi:hypothetical protein LWE61_02860 [Sphingobium sufflavum]|uniref:hypothetical protein n=1 Tax=Sphingobium sufflavum TaxID=1129547 RepID=UPI001F311C2A|nr:hypothetical protein [Sphingobium sufflavum]MCE7795493.1 hypothetical protein [Sphingobium sufflavum]